MKRLKISRNFNILLQNIGYTMKLKNVVINIGLAGLLGTSLAITLHDYPLYQELKQTQKDIRQALYINRAHQQIVIEEALRTGEIYPRDLFPYENSSGLIEKEYNLKDGSWVIKYLPDSWLREMMFFGEFIDRVIE